jgi:hypothetical protein
MAIVEIIIKLMGKRKYRRSTEKDSHSWQTIGIINYNRIDILNFSINEINWKRSYWEDPITHLVAGSLSGLY